MVLRVFVDEAAAFNGSVNLRGGEVGVAEHFLNGAQVGPVRQQVGGK
jgi:hypothetical protein